MEGGGAVHGGSGTEGVLNLLIQLVQLHQQQHHRVQSSMFTLSTEKNKKHCFLLLYWAPTCSRICKYKYIWYVYGLFIINMIVLPIPTVNHIKYTNNYLWCLSQLMPDYILTAQHWLLSLHDTKICSGFFLFSLLLLSNLCPVSWLLHPLLLL